MTIEVGDLVIQMKVHCERSNRLLGRIWRVTAIGHVKDTLVCSVCKTVLPAQPVAMNEHPGASPLSWLKRIPPLEEMEETETSKKEIA